MLEAYISGLAQGLGTFWRHRRGSAVVEFAIILPVAIMVYIGAAEVSDGVMTSRKVSTLTRTLVDLLSHQPTSPQATSPAATFPVSATTLSTLLTSSATLLFPKPTASLVMTISAVDVANTALGVCCTATVRWSFTQGGTLRPCNMTLLPGPDGAIGQLTTFPTDLLPVGTPLPSTLHYLVADVAYTYQPIFGTSLLTFAPRMTRTEYMMPRTIGQVTTATLPTSGAQYGAVCY